MIPAFNMHALEVRRTTASLCKKQNMLSLVKDVLIRINLHEDKKRKVIYFKRNIILIF